MAQHDGTDSRKWRIAWRATSQQQAALVILALLLGALAQVLFDRRAALAWSVPVMLVAAALFALTARMPVRSISAPLSGAPMVHGDLLRWGVVFAALAFFSFRGNRFNASGLIAWLLAMGLSVLATDGTPMREQRAARIGSGWGPWRLSWPTLGLLCALVAGAWLRFYRLLELPADLGWDLPYNYTDAERILQGEFLVFFPDNYGREGLFFYLAAFVGRGMGLSPYSIRVTSALLGVAAIPAIYLLARECADAPAATLAALGLALNKWHVVLSRSGYRVILMPLLTILALYALARGLRRGHVRDWAWLGLFLGLGLWSYKAFIFAVVTAAACALLYVLLDVIHRRRTNAPDHPDVWLGAPRARLMGLALALLVTAITATPLLRFVVDEPRTYLAREALGGQLVEESLARTGLTRWQLYSSNVLTSLGMFNYKGDGNPRFGVPDQRHLGFVSGVFFVLGVALGLRHWRRGANLLLLVALGGLTLPMTASMLAGELPNCFRASGVIGPAVVLAAEAMQAAYRALAHWVGPLGVRTYHLEWRAEGSSDQAFALEPRGLNLRMSWVWLPVALVALALLAEARETSRFYFDHFRQAAPDIQNYSVALEMANHIIAFEDGPAYIKMWPYWYDGRAVQAHLAAAGRPFGGELPELDPQRPPLLGFQGKLLILLHPEDRDDLALLQSAFTRYIVLADHYPDGQPSLLAFYGER